MTLLTVIHSVGAVAHRVGLRLGNPIKSLLASSVACPSYFLFEIAWPAEIYIFPTTPF
jgi:hypothetical protein